MIAAIEAALNEGAGLKPRKPLSKLSQVAGQVVAAGAKGLVKQTATRLIGEAATDELTALAASLSSAGKDVSVTAEKLFDEQGKAFLEKFRAGQRSIAEFRRELIRVLQGPMLAKRRLPLFVLVDELDRCRPNYAVSLLERMKHLFEIDDVVFVMATDTSQLQHSIRALYGSGFDSSRYLFRFFDQTYRFAKPSVEKFFAAHFSDIDHSKITGPPETKPDSFVAYIFEAFSIPLRDQQQCIDILRNCVTVWRSECPLQLFILLPLVIAQQQRLSLDYSGLEDRLRQSLGVKSFDWKLNFKIRLPGTSQLDIRNGFEVFNEVIQNFRAVSLVRFINDFDYDQKPTTVERIVHDLARLEMSIRARAETNRNGEEKSFVLDYPELVRSVGRLSPS